MHPYPKNPETDAMPTYLSRVDFIANIDRWATYPAPGFIQRISANIEVHRPKLMRPRPLIRESPLPMIDLFAKLKRRKQTAPSIEAKKRSRKR